MTGERERRQLDEISLYGNDPISPYGDNIPLSRHAYQEVLTEGDEPNDEWWMEQWYLVSCLYLYFVVAFKFVCWVYVILFKIYLPSGMWCSF
jgi:hypothetical protein